MRKAFSVLLATVIFLFPKDSDALPQRAPGGEWRETRIIDPHDTAVWHRNRKDILQLRDRLQRNYDGFWRIGANDSLTRNNRSDSAKMLCLRLAYLNRTLAEMDFLEDTSKQRYALQLVGSGAIEGETRYRQRDSTIVIAYNNSVANFVHEFTHAVEFETQDIAFFKTTGGALAQDWQDELRAYKAQFAYDPSSLTGLTSFSSITKGWLITLDSAGKRIYGPNGTARTGQIPVDINSSLADLRAACPDDNCRVNLAGTPTEYTLRSDTTHLVVYKPDAERLTQSLGDPGCL